MIKKSLTRKIIVVFSIILVSIIFLNIVINGVLLPKVHRNHKIDQMQTLYTSLEKQFARNDDLSEIIETVKETLSKENLRVFVWDSEDNLIIDSLPLSIDNSEKTKFPSREHATQWRTDSFKPHDTHDSFKGGRNELFLFDFEVKSEDILKKSDEYIVFSLESFNMANEKDLCLRGKLANDHKVLIQMPVASISETVYISNVLLLLSGIFMLFVGIFVVSLTARTITKPVKELSSIAKSMQSLDFSKKYKHNRNDEIGSLGNSINSLSEKLEYTIDELHKRNKELEQDIELKSKIDTLRKEFIANASHELKTPVALILGYAEGLRDGITDDKQSKELYMNVIIDEAARIDKIIHQMLDLMEIDSTEEALNKEVFSLSDLVENVINDFSVVIDGKNIDLEVDIDRCDICADYKKIGQAVTNYISNAVNHVDENLKISISLKNNGDNVAFLVYNSGYGIPHEAIDRIWERFFKVDKAHTREYGGTGLGLAIVRSVIEKHGGKYGVINHPDGVEFYFILDKVANDEI